MRREVYALLLLVLAAAVGMAGWEFWERRGASAEDRRIAELKSRLDERGGSPEDHYALGMHLAEREGKAEGLAHLELAAERAPSNLLYGNAVRLQCRRLEEYDRSIRFFERLTAANGDRPEPLVQLALAYVDKMPDHMMGLVGQGKLSKQSIAVLTRVIDAPAESMTPETRWAALYALGMNHLYWPKALRHAEAAEEAFRRCLAFQKTMKTTSLAGAPPGTPASLGAQRSDLPHSAGSSQADERRGSKRDPVADATKHEGPRPAYFMLPYLGLGDALVKEGRPSEAREVWREALGKLSEEPRLAERLAIEDDEALTDLVDRVRGLGVVVDTDLAILWGRRP